MRRLLACAALLLANACAPANSEKFQSVSFYLCPHEDDCVLFMNPNLLEDVSRKGNKVVSIYITAGDAGLGDSGEAGKGPYYAAREKGALASTRWMSKLSHGVDEAAGELSHVHVGPHTIAQYRYRDTVSYFLRLPDGMYTGEGAKKTGLQSLAKLKSGEVPRISAVDGSTSYEGWDALVGTLERIIRHEAAGIPRVALNIPDPDVSRNLGDHSDHTHTGLAGLAAVEGHPCIAVGEFLDYVTAEKPRNIDEKHLPGDIGAFDVMSRAIAAEGYVDIWDKEHRQNLERNYFRFHESELPCGF